MKFSGEKGQGALEYMQTYGWSILVVMVIGIVLWQLGVFGQHGTVNAATGFAKIRVLEPGIKYSSGTETDALTFHIVNTESSYIKFLGSTSNGDCANISISGTGLDAGKTATVTCTDCENLTAGESFEVLVTITYRTKIGRIAINHTDSGTVQGIVE